VSQAPVIVVGAGIAGLWTALRLAPLPVEVLTGPRAGLESASAWAQGGIAAALGPGDSPEAHARDTLAAGAGLGEPPAAAALAAAAPDEVGALEALGVPFEHADDGAWRLSREAAHSCARVVRVGGDRAGAAIMQTLVRRAREAPHIRLREGWRGTGLIAADGRCRGVVAGGEGRQGEPLAARAVVLATGGVGGLFGITTNPDGNRGEALAWAIRAGAAVLDAEFVQFHPTAIDVGRRPAPLATEALRGEGAILVDRRGRRFMPDVHPDAELAPRDVVARAVHRQRVEHGGAWLDARAALGERFPEQFPAVFAACTAAGIDPRRQPIPVAPAVHYHMGGIEATLAGRTGVDGLLAVGEAACTGVHGANRLASNSLLEALVTGSAAARALLGGEAARAGPLAAAPGPGVRLGEAALDGLRAVMSRHCGVERDAQGLDALLDRLDVLDTAHHGSDIVLAARLIAAAASTRTESVGAHARRDFPGPRLAPHHTRCEWQRSGLVFSRRAVDTTAARAAAAP